jgi:hypothetical protein
MFGSGAEASAQLAEQVATCTSNAMVISSRNMKLGSKTLLQSYL